MATRSILITIVCLVLAGLPTIFIVSGDDYGISHDNPLGRFWALDEVLEGLGMTGSDRVVDEYGKVRTFPSHLMVRQYRDPTSHGLIDWVLVGAQLDGRVVMVGGAFSGAHVPGLLVPDEKVHAF